MLDTVLAPNGRQWTVTRTAEWVRPAGADGFEVDQTGGTLGPIIVFGALAVFWVGLFLWMPARVHVPWYFTLVAVGLVLLIPVRWWVRRPWTVQVDSDGFGEDAAVRQTWVVSGRWEATRLAAGIVDRLKFTGRLADPDQVGPVIPEGPATA